MDFDLSPAQQDMRDALRAFIHDVPDGPEGHWVG